MCYHSGYDGRQQDANLLSSLDNLPLGTKKAAKCYVIARHPLNPEIVAVGSNAGNFLMRSKQFFAQDLLYTCTGNGDIVTWGRFLTTKPLVYCLEASLPSVLKFQTPCLMIERNLAPERLEPRGHLLKLD